MLQKLDALAFRYRAPLLVLAASLRSLPSGFLKRKRPFSVGGGRETRR